MVERMAKCQRRSLTFRLREAATINAGPPVVSVRTGQIATILEVGRICVDIALPILTATTGFRLANLGRRAVFEVRPYPTFELIQHTGSYNGIAGPTFQISFHTIFRAFMDTFFTLRLRRILANFIDTTIAAPTVASIGTTFVCFTVRCTTSTCLFKNIVDHTFLSFRTRTAVTVRRYHEVVVIQRTPSVVKPDPSASSSFAIRRTNHFRVEARKCHHSLI